MRNASYVVICERTRIAYLVFIHTFLRCVLSVLLYV